MIKSLVDWIFRVASRAVDGGGHVSRSLTLARAMRSKGARVSFHLDDKEHLHQKIRLAGFQTKTAGSLDVADGYLFDGYHFTADEINLAGHLSQSVAYVADHMSISDVDLIIRPGQPRMKGDPRNTLSGLKYAMISPRFSRYSSVDISPQIGSILIAFGLWDSKNATCKVLEALKYIGNTYNVNPDIYVTIGKETPHLYQIKGLVNALPNAELLLDHNDMPGLMKNCDFAIGAGGVGLLERMAAGLPSITVSIAENQVNQSQLCARAGGTIYLGPVEGLDDDLLISCLVDLFRDNLHRAELSCKAREAVDGTGVLKVAEALMQLGCHDNGVEYSAEQGRLNG